MCSVATSSACVLSVRPLVSSCCLLRLACLCHRRKTLKALKNRRSFIKSHLGSLDKWRASLLTELRSVSDPTRLVTRTSHALESQSLGVPSGFKTTMIYLGLVCILQLYAECECQQGHRTRSLRCKINGVWVWLRPRPNHPTVQPQYVCCSVVYPNICYLLVAGLLPYREVDADSWPGQS